MRGYNTAAAATGTATPSSLPNLLRFLREHTQIDAAAAEVRVQIMDEELFSHPYIYMTGHGKVAFSAAEAARLRHYLESGGFLHADDNYGMDESFRRAMRQVFPHAEWVELPPEHPLFHCHFELPAGLPKVHEHDGKRPQALALFTGERLAVLYTYEADLGRWLGRPRRPQRPRGQATQRPQNGCQYRGLGTEPLVPRSEPAPNPLRTATFLTHFP